MNMNNNKWHKYLDPLRVVNCITIHSAAVDIKKGQGPEWNLADHSPFPKSFGFISQIHRVKQPEGIFFFLKGRQNSEGG